MSIRAALRIIPRHNRSLPVSQRQILTRNLPEIYARSWAARITPHQSLALTSICPSIPDPANCNSPGADFVVTVAF
jgi:hypothetical protein